MSLLSPQLEAFVAVATLKTVHGAAGKINLTQTAVTQRIRTLEHSLATTLFIRTRRGMMLTPEGEALLRYCHAAKSLEGEALSQIQGAGTQAEIILTISAPTSFMQSRVMPACLSIMQDFPNLLLNFNVNDLENRHQSLQSGKSDLVVLHEENLAQEMQHKKLNPQEYILVGSARWKGRKLSDIISNERIVDFDSADQMTFNYLKAFALFEQCQHGRYYINRTEFIATLIAEGVGYSALPRDFVQQYVLSNQLMVLNEGKSMQVNHLLAWYDRPEPPRYFSAIVDAIN